MKQKTNALLLAAMTIAMMTAGCSSEPEREPEIRETNAETSAATEKETAESNVSAITQTDVPYSFDAAALFSERDRSGDDEETCTIVLNDSSAAISGSGASADGSVIRITEEGVYRITGVLDDGQIVVHSEGKVQLVLDNANISCSDSSAIYVENAKKTFITLAGDSVNSVSDGESYRALTEEQNGPDAAIFSKDSLTINGTGSLIVNGNYNEGITSKDDLVICSAEITVNAVGNGIKGKDYVAVSDAVITVQAGGDGLKSSNSTDAGMGFVYVESGSLVIEADGDGIQAETELVIDGGEISVVAGGGIENAKPHTDSFGGGFGGWFENDAYGTKDDSVSVKGLKAGCLLFLSGGTLDVEAADDTLHSNGDLLILEGVISLRAGSKGIHADANIDIYGGEITVAESYEGIEAANILVTDGVISVTSSDDGFNASDGSAQGAAGGTVDCALTIAGGHVYINAEGDGLDSNGSLLVSGGVVLVDGPQNPGNGALDANGEIICTGGLLIAAGSMGMAEYPSGSQNTIVITTSTQQGNTLMTICGENGEVLSYAPSKSWSSCVVSSPVLNSGEQYTVYIGGSSSAAQVNGLYETGGYQNDGTEEGSVSLDDVISFIGASGGMGGGKGGFGGHQMPDNGWERDHFNKKDFNRENFDPGNMEFPTDENGNPVQPDPGRGNGQFPEGMQPPADGNFSMPDDSGRGHQGGRGGFVPDGDFQNS